MREKLNTTLELQKAKPSHLLLTWHHSDKVMSLQFVSFLKGLLLMVNQEETYSINGTGEKGLHFWTVSQFAIEEMQKHKLFYKTFDCELITMHNGSEFLNLL